jgi:hypothetical protein
MGMCFPPCWTLILLLATSKRQKAHECAAAWLYLGHLTICRTPWAEDVWSTLRRHNRSPQMTEVTWLPPICFLWRVFPREDIFRTGILPSRRICMYGGRFKIIVTWICGIYSVTPTTTTSNPSVINNHYHQGQCDISNTTITYIKCQFVLAQSKI